MAHCHSPYSPASGSSALSRAVSARSSSSSRALPEASGLPALGWSRVRGRVGAHPPLAGHPREGPAHELVVAVDGGRGEPPREEPRLDRRDHGGRHLAGGHDREDLAQAPRVAEVVVRRVGLGGAARGALLGDLLGVARERALDGRAGRAGGVGIRHGARLLGVPRPGEGLDLAGAPAGGGVGREDDPGAPDAVPALVDASARHRTSSLP